MPLQQGQGQNDQQNDGDAPESRDAGLQAVFSMRVRPCDHPAVSVDNKDLDRVARRSGR